jgi:hypothetical protein
MVIRCVAVGNLHAGREPLPLRARGATVRVVTQRPSNGATSVRVQGDVQPDV